ncbi:endodeoxyribonuclease [Exophiala xenobiotica]|nr:endodeoxyribonuclease [Exophiala xenobiotica]
MENDADSDMLDVPLPPGPSRHFNNSAYENSKVLTFINNTIDNINAALCVWPHGEVNVVLKRVKEIEHQRGTVNNASIGHGQTSKNAKMKVSYRQMKYSWPGNTPDEAWRFSMTPSHNDIYYRQPELFRKQETVDRYIDDIAFTCGVTRKDLRVTASPKGLLCGLALTANDIFEPDNIPGARVQLVSSDLDDITAQHISHLRWILVVEKEASFKTLVEKRFDTQCSLGPGLIVTAKGYPDLNTHLFLRHILDLARTTSQPLPVFSLVDCDPDGLDIHRCYSTPPRPNIHEADASIPDLHWLGVDIIEWLGEKRVMDRCLTLTKRDRGRARGILGRMVEDDGEAVVGMGIGDGRSRMKRCLQTMLMLGVKAEIQAVDDEAVGGGLCGWLERGMVEARGY